MSRRTGFIETLLSQFPDGVDGFNDELSGYVHLEVSLKRRSTRCLSASQSQCVQPLRSIANSGGFELPPNRQFERTANAMHQGASE